MTSREGQPNAKLTTVTGSSTRSATFASQWSSFQVLSPSATPSSSATRSSSREVDVEVRVVTRVLAGHEHVHPERGVGELTGARDLGSHLVGLLVPRGQEPEPAGLAHRGRQRGARRAATHRRLDHRDARQLGQPVRLGSHEPRLPHGLARSRSRGVGCDAPRPTRTRSDRDRSQWTGAARAHRAHRVLLEVGRGREAALPALLRRAASCATRRARCARTATRTSGRRPRCRAAAVVAGFTLNEQMWIPSFPPPYVIAIVAIEEDDRIRLTTNLVNCDADDVFVGMKVQVRVRARRRRVDPAVRADRRDRQGPVPRRRPEDPRRPPDAEGGRQVRGQGRDHRHRHVAGRPAAHGRPDRARRSRPPSRRSPTPGSTVDDIDGLSTYPGGALGGGMSEGGITAIEEVLRVRPSWINGGHRDARPGRRGDRGDARGRRRPVQARPVLPHRVGGDVRGQAAGGDERRARQLERDRAAWAATASAATCSGACRTARRRRPTGSACRRSAHFDRYGTTRETLGRDRARTGARTPRSTRGRSTRNRSRWTTT